MKLSLLLILMIATPLMAGEFGKERGKLNPEEIYQKITQKKYEKMVDQLRLTKEEQGKLFPILKKYDRKMFELRPPKHGKKFRKEGEQGDYTAKLKRMRSKMKERLTFHRKRFEITEAKIVELQNNKIPDELIVKVLKFEKRFHRAVMKRFRKHHQNRRGERGNRRSRGSFGFGPGR